MVELCGELKFAKDRHQRILKEEETGKQQIIDSKLKPKGQLLLNTNKTKWDYCHFFYWRFFWKAEIFYSFRFVIEFKIWNVIDIDNVVMFSIQKNVKQQLRLKENKNFKTLSHLSLLLDEALQTAQNKKSRKYYHFWLEM